MTWQGYLIDDFVSEGKADIQTGPFGTQLSAAEYVNVGVPVINVRNIGHGKLKPDKLEYVSEETAERLSVHRLQNNDIVFGRKGAVDRHILVAENQDGWIQGSDCIRLRFHSKDISPQFISYAFLRPEHQQWMLTQAGNKATMASLNQDVIRRIQVSLPSLGIQLKVVHILSAYDDLIENNHRRMAKLEEAALLLYREWFVRLRFPGHEHTRIVNGMPEAWTQYALSDLVKIGRGASPRPIVDFMGGDIPWFKIGDATASESHNIFFTEDHVTEPGAKRSIMLEPGSLILSNSATCGIPFFTAVKGCIHDGWLYFSDYNRISSWFCYCFLNEKRQELINSVSDGSTQKNLNTSAAGRLRLILPPNEHLINSFNDMAQPTMLMIRVLARQNIALRTARDLLLPRLMSGEIAA